MDLLPAIDIRNGRVVRLTQGEQSRQTVYGEDPIAVAERFAADGARWLHVVDLDRAFGTGENLTVVRQVARRMASALQLQLGGGLRSAELIHEALDLGFARVVVGTAAVSDVGFVPALLQTIDSKRLAVGIDARDGMVAVRGWTETSTTRAEELARRVVDSGIQTLIYTDITRDGMLSGPDLAGALVLQRTGGRVVVSGGIAGVADIEAACRAGLDGVIVGRALYAGRMTVPEAIQAAACSSSS
ncbi:MAG TPA: 1-(5-phosphoribosyl)-5-[(5-phosphoribosylamino)methylideneamino]imidazole-4-carboxamide isomerase [Gemmatimonadales bacterium]|nr:1-(5-phosphoribosyl)-5-[(5-phosphoribosylamino)methylideneamino]imidazole-4-carboxamide isomerase [Gemmatimonadales bacterium]